MTDAKITAEVITIPGNLGDTAYCALQVNVDGFQSPYVLTLALPVVGYRALARQIDPGKLYKALSDAINAGAIHVNLEAEETAAGIRKAAAN